MKKGMRKFFKSFEDTMAAAAYAEAGEFETVREIVNESRRVLLALSGERVDANAFHQLLDYIANAFIIIDNNYVQTI